MSESTCAKDDELMCTAIEDGWLCTRVRGHEGDHHAHGVDEEPKYIWPQQEQTK